MLVPISLVITVYNRERYLGAAIESVLAQTRGDWELLVWDDGSTDCSVEIAQHYARQDARVRVVAAQHQGRVPALKDAIAHTKGTYIGFVDSDDILAPTALEETAAVLDAHPATGLVYTDYLVMNERGEVTGYGNRCRLPYSPAGLLRKFITFHFRLIRRTVFEQVGGINESFYLSEDYELCLRLSEVTQVQRVSKPLYYYRVHRESISQQQKAEQNRFALVAIKQARQRRQHADNFPVTLLNGAEFSTPPSQNLHIAPLVQTGLIHSLQTRLGINSTASSQSRFQPTAKDRAILVHFNGLELLARSLNSGRVSGKRISPTLFKGGWGDLKRLQSSKVIQESVSSLGKRFTQSLAKNFSPFLAALPLLGAITVTPALAQIVPAADGTNTLVNTTANQLDITGGQTSSNGANLFHSFSQFDLNTGQTANFQSNSTIQNILGRVVSGNASNINGLIQVSGSQANLYLMNPAGIIFGSNASLNVPGSFVATTATSIGIGNSWFNAAGTNDYAQLNGAPSAFAFTTPQPGSIVNSGNLAVGAGKDLMLLGGTVVSTGQVNAPAGQIKMAAVPGTSLVRLSQPGSVLSLEVLPPASGNNSPTQWTLPVLSLPQLLTGGSGGNATGISVNAAGQAVLTGSDIIIENGDVVAKNVTAQEATLTANHNLTLVDSTLTTTGDMNLLAQDTVRVRDSVASPVIAQAGGKLLIQGNQNIDIFALNNPASGLFSGGDMVLRSTNTVGGDAHYFSGGNFRIETLDGSLGNLFSPYDPVIRASGDVNFASYTGASLHIFAGGSVTITGNVTITGVDAVYGLAENVTLSDGTVLAINGRTQPTLDIRAGTTAFGTPGIIGGGTFTPGIPGTAGTGTSANITIGSITMAPTGLVFLTNQYSPNETLPGGAIQVGNISAGNSLGLDGGSIVVDSRSNILSTGRFDTFADSILPTNSGKGGDITLLAGGDITFTTNDIDTHSSYGENSGGNVTLKAGGNINLLNISAFGAGGGGNVILTGTGDININGSVGITTNAANGNGGNITLSSTGGAINATARSLDSNSSNGNGGTITLSAFSNITAGSLNSVSRGSGNKGGDININAGGNFTASSVISIWQGTTTGNGGDITVNAGGDISSQGDFLSFTDNGRGGNITLTAGGNIFTDDIYSIGSLSSGDIKLTSGGTIDNTFADGTPGLISSCSGTGNTCSGGSGRGGNITLEAATRIATAINANGPLGGGNIILTSNEIDLRGTTSNGGTLLVQPFTSSQNIVIAGAEDSGTGTLDITTNDLDAIAFGFTSLTIGRSDGSGAITLNPVTFDVPTIIQTSTGAGSITTTPGNIRTNGNNLTLISNQINTSASTIDTGDDYYGGGDINITAPGGITLGNLTAMGSSYYGYSPNPNGGDITLSGPVTLANNNTSITTGISDGLGAGNINFSSTINGTTPGVQSLNLTVGTGTVTLGDAVGGINPLGNLNVTGGNGSQVFVGSDITIANNNLTFDQPVTLTGKAIFNAGTGTIGFNSSLATGNNALTLTADEINFAGGANSVTGTSNLLLQPFTPTQNIAIAGATDSGTGILDITTTDITAWLNGFNSITIGGANSSGAINILNPVTLFDPVTIQAPVGAGTINATGAITGLDNASITLKANQNITTTNITANPGITIISSNGTIDTSAGILDSSSTTANGGVISLSALGNITTNNLTSHSDTGAGGDITLNSQTGVISSGNLDASGNTRGGNITVMAKNQITAGQLNSSAITGDGGNVFLDPIGDIQVDSINSQGGISGKGGSVDITTNQFFRAVGSFSDRNGINASISTAGGTGSGDIILRHDGGARGIPFNVGDATINGTAGAITTSSANSILPLQSFPGAYTQGNIQIITQNPPPPPPPPTLPPATPSPSPQPDTNQIPKDIQGENLVPQGINTISTSAIVLLNTTAIVREEIDQALDNGQIEKAIALIEQLRMQEFQNHFEGNLTSDTGESGSVEQTQAVLSDIATNTGKTPAVIYVFTQPDQLQLILVTPKDKPLLKTVYQANKETLLKTAAKFRSQVTEPRSKTGYQQTAKQLYQWLVEPLEAELQANKIDTLVFSMDGGLRSLPMAALYDGKQFLVEKYSIGLIPSINLTDTRYGDVKTTEVLAMGASKFTEQDPLPAVPIELSTLVGKQNLAAENRELLPANPSSSDGLWTGKSFLNQGFTLTNLKAQREQTPFGVIHLATHGEFNLGAPRNSYIQLSDSKLRLDQLRQMGWNNPPVELLVLSACRTALGNEDAEFGFGGLAVAAGVKSAIASLWYVSDEGTLGLITEFYQQLKTAPIKAEALRQAQIAMIKGQVRIEKGQLQGIRQGESIPLPPELAEIDNKDFSHPYYWSAFTMIGSPW
jgi:filamentous hemagglutinin family protein